MRRLLGIAIVVISLATAVPVAAQVEAPGETYEQVINDPSLTADHSVVIRLYQAVLGRQPDAAGLRFWLDSFTSDAWSTRRIANFFITSDEFMAVYGQTSNEQFVDEIYRNVLGRTADLEGSAFWLSQLEAGMSRGELVLLISNAPEFIDANLLPSDLPDFAAMSQGTIVITEIFEVDGELIGSELKIAFDFSHEQPIVHQWIDYSQIVETYAREDGPVLASEQLACEEARESESEHQTCLGPAVGFAMLGAHLRPLESFFVGTFDQIRAHEAPGVVATVGSHATAINGRRIMLEQFWPGADNELLGFFRPVQLVDRADEDRWASLEPHPDHGLTFNHIDVAVLLSRIDKAPTVGPISWNEEHEVWTIRDVPSMPASGFVTLEPWTTVESTVTVTAQTDPAEVTVPSPLMSRDELFDLVEDPCTYEVVDGNEIGTCPPTQ